MNVFEDLVVELKEENLLEETVALPPKTFGDGVDSVLGGLPSNGNGNGHKNGSSSNGKRPQNFRPNLKPDSAKTNPSDQMTALQFVEFVVSASERLDGASVTPFDELQVQKAFHRYTQSSSDRDGDEFFEAECAVTDALRSWEEDLVQRDTSVPVGTLRRFAEGANPPLSPQALFALLRFYRSVPVSENAYLKFDFVVTRLFSKFVDGERRDMLCSRSEVVKHLNQRYSEWGMNAFKALPADDPDVALVCLSFDDFTAEVESASRISDLLGSKLFERLYELKRSSGAMFFVPQVTAAAIDSNLRISRRLYELLALEIKRSGAVKSSNIDVELVSNAIGRTFDLVVTGDAASRSFSSDEVEVSRPAAKRSVKPPRTVKTKPAKGS